MHARWVAAAVAACAVAAAAVPAFAAGPAVDAGAKRKMAEEHFRRGKALGEVGRYDESIREFQEAYVLMEELGESVPEILLNIALNYRRLERYAEAIEFYRRYLSRAPEAKNRASVEAIIAELERKRDAAKPGPASAKKGRLRVTTDPPGAAIILGGPGGARIGATPLVVEVEPGSHIVRLELPGYVPQDRSVVVEAGKEAVLLVALEPVPARPPGPATGPTPALPRPPIGPGYLSIIGNVPDAFAYVDGRHVGRLPHEAPLPVAAGAHRIEVRAPDFQPFVANVYVWSGRITPVDAGLVPDDKRLQKTLLKHYDDFVRSGLTLGGYDRVLRAKRRLIGGLVGAGISALVMGLIAGAVGDNQDTSEVVATWVVMGSVSAGFLGLAVSGAVGMSKRHDYLRVSGEPAPEAGPAPGERRSLLIAPFALPGGGGLALGGSF